MTAGASSVKSRDTHQYQAMHRTTEYSAQSSALQDAIARDHTTLMRHVFDSMRVGRYVAAPVLGAVAIAVRHDRVIALAVALIVGAYVLLVWLAGRVMGDRRAAEETRLKALRSLFLADIACLSMLSLVIGPDGLTLILLGGLVLVSLGTFHLGHRAGIAVGACAALAYVVSVVVLRFGLYVARPTWVVAAISAGAFLAGCTALVGAFGTYRRRLDALRHYCRMAELGEGASAIPIDTSHEPDDLTLLAGSFDAMRNRLAEQVGSDPLTGCANRRTFETRLLADWRLARRHGAGVGVAAIDIDHFKQINDTRGHPVGDLVLQQIASIMLGTARESDTVARLGGDEFAIILPDTDHAGAQAFGERLRQRVVAFTFGPAGDPLSITISVGVATGAGADAIEPDQLIADADRLLYQAKTEGRNRVRG